MEELKNIITNIMEELTVNNYVTFTNRISKRKRRETKDGRR